MLKIEIPKCGYNYHDDSHPSLCEFESALDIFLDDDSRMTKDAIEFREELIKGVERMYVKIKEFQTTMLK